MEAVLFPSATVSMRDGGRSKRSPQGSAVFDTENLQPMSLTLASEDRQASRVDLGWVIGSIVAALAGSIIFGSVLYYSTGHDMSVLEWPEIANTQRSGNDNEPQSTVKGDKLIIANDIISARQNFRVPTSIKIGDREVIKPVPYVRVATNLALNSIGLGDDIPPFDPQKFFAGAGAEPVSVPDTLTT